MSQSFKLHFKALILMSHLLVKPQIAFRPRTIRSYVRREGRITTRQQLALNSLWEKFGLNPNVSLSDLTTAFVQNAPCILEIGFGMGHSLLTMAKIMPEWNFIGIEVYRPGIGSLLAELAVQRISNVRVYCADAQEVLIQCLPDASLQGIQIFFPDPWPKKRHHKRRLINTDFARLLSDKLQGGGYLHIATDWQDYAQQMLQIVSEVADFHNPYAAGFAPRPATRPITKFEQRSEKLGHAVWDLIVFKRENC
ncbi:MAG: tRNA (guanosine(46)-N7)-methyltransferase TrmB [Gammaproteobacteria bacterium]